MPRRQRSLVHTATYCQLSCCLHTWVWLVTQQHYQNKSWPVGNRAANMPSVMRNSCAEYENSLRFTSNSAKFEWWIPLFAPSFLTQILKPTWECALCNTGLNSPPPHICYGLGHPIQSLPGLIVSLIYSISTPWCSLSFLSSTVTFIASLLSAYIQLMAFSPTAYFM